jgi:hypothetical protein
LSPELSDPLEPHPVTVTAAVAKTALTRTRVLFFAVIMVSPSRGGEEMNPLLNFWAIYSLNEKNSIDLPSF